MHDRSEGRFFPRGGPTVRERMTWVSVGCQVERNRLTDGINAYQIKDSLTQKALNTITSCPNPNNAAPASSRNRCIQPVVYQVMPRLHIYDKFRGPFCGESNYDRVFPLELLRGAS